MWKKTLKGRKNYLILALILIISFALMTANSKRSGGPFFFETAVLWVVSPIQNAFTYTVDSINGVFDHYFYLVGVTEKNEELEQEMGRLARENHQLKEEINRLQRVGRLFQYQEQNELKSVVARVIGRDATQWIKAIYINKGSLDGIKENLAVVTDAGVVGHVIQAGLNSSKVLLVVDRRSAVDALFQESRVPGVVVGNGLEICEIKYVPISAPIQIGEQVLSSGLGGVYPKGLIVGRVSQVNKSKQGLFQEIRLHPSADLARLEEVLVLLS